MYSGGCENTRSSERQNAPTPPMSAPGGLARRFWGDASANHMSVTSLREHALPNIMGHHRRLRRATPSAETMRERRQTAQALFRTKKKVGLFLDTATGCGRPSNSDFDTLISSIIRMGRMGGGSHNGTPRTDLFPSRPDIRTSCDSWIRFCF